MLCVVKSAGLQIGEISGLAVVGGVSLRRVQSCLGSVSGCSACACRCVLVVGGERPALPQMFLLWETQARMSGS